MNPQSNTEAGEEDTEGEKYLFRRGARRDDLPRYSFLRPTPYVQRLTSRHSRLALLAAFLLSWPLGPAFGKVFWKKRSPVQEIPSALAAIAKGRFHYDNVVLHGINLDMEGIVIDFPFADALRRACGGMRIIESKDDYAIAYGRSEGFVTVLLARQTGQSTQLFRISALEKELAKGLSTQDAFRLDDARFPFECRVFADKTAAQTWLGKVGGAMQQGRIQGAGISGSYIESSDGVVVVVRRL